MSQKKNTKIKLRKSKIIYKIIKRIVDIVISLAVMVGLFFVYLIIALGIFIDDKRPIIFTQLRVGKNFQMFTIYKFRTMENSKKSIKEENKYNWNKRVPDDFVFKSSSSSKVTDIGKILRKYSLDELPQFFNVLKGDMSIVGPRPEIPEIAQHYDEKQLKRLIVKPGITGLAQINGRSDITHGEKIKYDLEYVKNRSLIMDIKIILKTIINTIKGEGAY